jgi:hypothetical protein
MTEPDLNFLVRQGDRILAEMGSIASSLADLRMRASALEGVIGLLVTQVAAINIRLDNFETRIDRIERRLNLIEA